MSRFYVSFVIFFFFFFKQKTAYEMRISDWSSDVCSSDLARRRCGRATPSAPVPRARSVRPAPPPAAQHRSEEHTSELQSLMRISYAVFCLKKKNKTSPLTRYANVYTALQITTTNPKPRQRKQKLKDSHRQQHKHTI